MRHVVAAGAGFVLALALGFARLTQPSVILGWVDVRHWDPTLLWFMIGATLAYRAGYEITLRRARPVFACEITLPAKRAIDARLLAGSAIFGVGWALGGACPGPAITSLGAGASWALPFVAAMLLGLRLGELQTAPFGVSRLRSWRLSPAGWLRVLRVRLLSSIRDQ